MNNELLLSLPLLSSVISHSTIQYLLFSFLKKKNICYSLSCSPLLFILFKEIRDYISDPVLVIQLRIYHRSVIFRTNETSVFTFTLSDSHVLLFSFIHFFSFYFYSIYLCDLSVLEILRENIDSIPQV